eukprot:gene28091-1207_t
MLVGTGFDSPAAMVPHIDKREDNEQQLLLLHTTGEEGAGEKIRVSSESVDASARPAAVAASSSAVSTAVVPNPTSPP